MMNSKKALLQLKKIKRLTKGKEMRLAGDWSEDWQVLIATILSAVTRDEVTIVVCEKLFRKYPSINKLSRARIGTIEKMIRPINFYKNKSKNILATAKLLRGKEIPIKIEELLKLPGVGRKVANVYLIEAHKKDVIGVDTHVARISFKLGWTQNKNPNKIEKDLEKLFPKKYWNEINRALVIFGKSVGLSRKKEDLVLEELRKTYKRDIHF